MFFVTRMDGVVDIWDYFYRQNEVAYSHKVRFLPCFNHPWPLKKLFSLFNHAIAGTWLIQSSAMYSRRIEVLKLSPSETYSRRSFFHSKSAAVLEHEQW